MANTWYYEDEGVQVGPLTETEFNDLVRIGKIAPETLVWNEGLPAWKPLSEVRPSTSPARPSKPNLVACSECGNSFPPEDLIQMQGRWICAACKPIVVQRLKEGVGGFRGGVPGERSSDPNVIIEEVRRRDYTVEIGANIKRSWELVKQNFWPSVGVTVIVTMIQQMPAIIPILGPIATLVLAGPLYGGLYYFFIKLVRSEPADIGDGFKGFGPRWGQLILAQLIPVLLIYCLFIPAAVVGMALGEFEREVPGIGFFGLALVALPFAVYLSVCWFFTVPLVMDRGLRFWDAMNVSRKAVHAHWGGVFGYLVVAGLVNVLGILACCVGLFVSLPVFFCASMHLYEDIFSGPSPTPYAA